MTSDGARHRLIRGQREFSSYVDEAPMAVGRDGTRSSLAFDSAPAHFDPQQFASPAAAAGVGTRAAVVWNGLRTWHGEPLALFRSA